VALIYQEGRGVVDALLRRFSREPLARTMIALYELPMQYPSVRWRQELPVRPPAVAAGAAESDAARAARQEADLWLVRTIVLLIENQVPLLTRELQGRVIGRLDEYVDYRITWDKFAQQAPPREEGGLLLAELDVWIMPGSPPKLRVNLHRHATARTAFSLLATILDGFTTDTIRIMPSVTQSWACLWLTYLIQWYNAGGPAALAGRASRHPNFYLPGGVPEEQDFPQPE
jgi:hypothetical protein